ncbi:MAG: Eco47II family restriction endonuclease [Arcobacteraceae bacterium]|nr:Eco47II family restriction endonuclease [Arcobacteraceae bacterium]
MEFLRDNENIKEIISTMIKEFRECTKKKDIHSEVIDPFSSIIEASINNLDYDNWIKSEQARQNQKTLQNIIGDLHQKLLANIKDIEDLGVGEVVDIVCHKKKIIAEIKNKHNTTKGNHKKEIYDDMVSLLEMDKYSEYTGYYVEIIPKKPLQFNSEFTPSDNITKTNRPKRSDIRKIDGKSFYELLTDDPNALQKMYNKIQQILTDDFELKEADQFKKLFLRAYDINFLLKEKCPDILRIESDKNIQLIESEQYSISRKLTWKHGECIFQTTIKSVSKDLFKCPICKEKL